MKVCGRCKEEKPLGEYHIDKRRDVPRSHCKQCARTVNAEWRAKNPEKSRQINREGLLRFKLKHTYNLSEEDYRKAVEDSGGRCAICKRVGKLFIDHCHDSGNFRGLLCTKCNTGIGMFEDSLNFLQSAIEYLTASGRTV